MIIWLGSYPRSGISGLSMALHHCFGLPSYSMDNMASKRPVHVAFVDHDLSPEAFLDQAERSDDIYLTETFGSPCSGERAIYLVRDGRSAVYSYWQIMTQHREMLGDSTAPLATFEEVVVGRTPHGSWSQHVDEWTQPGAHQLLLTYEQLIQDDRALIEQVAQFLDREPIRERYLDALPKIVSDASIMPYEDNDVGIAEIMRRCPDLFEAAHGEMMRQLGYEPPLVSPLPLRT